MFVPDSESLGKAVPGITVCSQCCRFWMAQNDSTAEGSTASDQEDVLTDSQSEVFQPGNVILHQSGMYLKIPSHF